MNDVLRKCNLCPRNCGVNRYENVGFCKAGAKIKLAYYSLINGKNQLFLGRMVLVQYFFHIVI